MLHLGIAGNQAGAPACHSRSGTGIIPALPIYSIGCVAWLPEQMFAWFQQSFILKMQGFQHGLCPVPQGALPGLVGLLKRYVPFSGPPNPGASVVRRAADAITNLAHENVSIKSRVRTEGGIPPLVALLDSYDAKVHPNALAKKINRAELATVLGQHCLLREYAHPLLRM